MDQLKLIGPVILSGILRSLDGSSTTEAGLLPLLSTLPVQTCMWFISALLLLIIQIQHPFDEKLYMLRLRK
jgi:hypothetical protein